MAVAKSVSIAIGADTKGFIDSLKKADKQITATTRLANELEKGLQLEFNEKNFVQAQKQVQSALQQTADKAQSIRDKLKFLEESGRVDTKDYEALELELAKTETTAIKLEKKLKEIDKIKLDNVNKGFTDLSSKLSTAAKNTAALSVAAGGLLAGMTKLAKSAVATGDEIATNADKYDLSAEALQRWNYVALQTDVSAESLYKAMSKTRDVIGTGLVGGSNAATKAIQSLGLSVDKIGTGEQGFEQIVEALSNIKDSTTQAYYANEIFGEKLATDLIPLLKQGGDAIKQYSEEFAEVGYLSNEQVAGLAKFDNEMNKVNTQFQNAKTQLGVALLPIYQTLANLLQQQIIPAIQKVTNWFGSMSEHAQKVATGVLLLTAALAPMLGVTSKIIGLIPNLLSGLNMLSAHPIIAIIGVVAGLLAYLYSTNEEFAESVNKLVKVLSKALSAVLKPIMNLLTTVFKILEPIADLIANILAPAFEFLSYVLEPVVWLLEKIVNLVNKAGDFVLRLVGKGWLWGKESDDNTSSSSSSSSTPNLDDYYSNIDFNLPKTGATTSYDYSSDNYNIELNVNSTGELGYDARALADEVIKQIAIKKQALGR